MGAGYLKRYLLTIIFVSFSFVIFKPFVANQLALRGHDYLNAYVFDEAIRTYKKALIFNPKDTEVRNWMGYAYDRSGNAENAIKTYKKTIEIDPHNIVALFDLGMVYYNKKDFVLARQYLLKAHQAPYNGKIDASEYRFYHRGAQRMLAHSEKKLKSK